MARLTQPEARLAGPPKPGTPPPDARQWLIDNDLWDDDFGMPPELTRVKHRWGDDGSPRRAAD